MIHKELKAREERIRRLTERVPKEIDKHLEALQEPNERETMREIAADAKEYGKWACRLYAATLAILVVVAACLMGILVA